jgi:hypothetical protein
MGGWPAVNRHDRLLLRKRGVSLPRRVTFRPLTFGKCSCGHVVLHHGAFLQHVSDRVRMIWAGCFEKLFEVIGGLPRLALRIVLGVTNVLVILTLITTSGDRDSMWLPLQPPLVTSSTPLCTLVGCLGWRSLTNVGGCLGTALHKHSPDRSRTRGKPGGDVEEFFCSLWLVMAKLMYQGSTVYARPDPGETLGSS